MVDASGNMRKPKTWSGRAARREHEQRLARDPAVPRRPRARDGPGRLRQASRKGAPVRHRFASPPPRRATIASSVRSPSVLPLPAARSRCSACGEGHRLRRARRASAGDGVRAPPRPGRRARTVGASSPQGQGTPNTVPTTPSAPSLARRSGTSTAPTASRTSSRRSRRSTTGHATTTCASCSTATRTRRATSASRVFRRALQARFGDGGRGFVSIGKPWKTLRAGRHARRHDEGVRAATGRTYKDAQLAGRRVLRPARRRHRGVEAPGARAWTERHAALSHVEIAYWQDPRGGSFDVFIDGAQGRARRDARDAAGLGLLRRSTWPTRRTRSSSARSATARSASSG